MLRLSCVVPAMLLMFIPIRSEAENTEPSKELLRAMWPADSFHNEGDLHGAIDEFRKVYPKYPAEPILLYNYASALALANQADSAFKYLSSAARYDASEEVLACAFF